MTSFAYVVDVVTNGFRADALFNGWPICRGDWPNGKIVSQKLNFFVLEGKNRLEVALSLAELAKPDVERWFQLRLIKTKHGEEEREQDILLRYIWTPDESPVAGAHMTPVFEHEMTFRRAYGAWAWESAPPYMPHDRADVVDVVAELHRALVARDLPAVLSMFAHANEEFERAVELPRGDQAAKHGSAFSAFFAAPDFAVAPLDRDALVLETACGGRLVRVLGPGGEAPLGFFAAGDGTELPLSLAKIDGRWLVAR